METMETMEMEPSLMKRNDEIMRVGLRFFEEIKEIKETIKENLQSRRKFPDRELTTLIVRHKHWEKVKKEIIQFVIDKEEPLGPQGVQNDP